ncbi:unnamed protein product [Protopolystoma xenopodis]|uniref:RWD domain-containing protein n=1 Tax=Protopolystoma xenopodis TaxID=117903 RepID=A0A3S5FDZ7_9PLAT|nr:unnamed protein product [Protopolystoma xenopodis]
MVYVKNSITFPPTMSLLDPREEEKDVLKSIYEGDEFSVSDDFVIQYKFGVDGTTKSFILSIVWPIGYPDKQPVLSLDSFYNNHLSSSLKDKIISDLSVLSNSLLGTALTFTLIEHTRENLDSYFEMNDSLIETIEDVKETSARKGTKTLKAEHMSKSQKKRYYNRLGKSGKLERGWNWVNIIHHLSQLGSQ